MFQNKHKLCREVTNIFALTLFTVSAGYGQFRETGQLTSNNITALAGNGDTVWIATERGLNYQISLDDKKEWRGFETDKFGSRFLGLAFGGGGAAALMHEGGNRFSFWHFDHKSGKQQQEPFRFSGFSNEDETLWPAGGIIFFDNKFWAPFKDGGMICYDPVSRKIEALRPNEEAVSPENLSPPVNKSSESVLSIAVVGDSLLITTPFKLWYYDNQSNSWSGLFDGVSGVYFGNEFIAAFMLNDKLYSFINIKDKIEFYLSDDEYIWNKALNNTPLGIFPAGGGRFYALFENNQAAMFDGTEEKLTAHEFRTLLAAAGEDPDPKVNDILFLPRTESEPTGTFIAATSSGLYFSKYADPQTNHYPDMISVRHIRKLNSNESYALPGVIRSGSEGVYEKAVFVYKLSKNGNVTISVYDYNMNHVKTVINRERREARTPSGRSTVPAADFWDGTNKAGRRVSPGVYYYKITSTGGDRFLGKVILAK